MSKFLSLYSCAGIGSSKTILYLYSLLPRSFRISWSLYEVSSSSIGCRLQLPEVVRFFGTEHKHSFFQWIEFSWKALDRPFHYLIFLLQNRVGTSRRAHMVELLVCRRFSRKLNWTFWDSFNEELDWVVSESELSLVNSWVFDSSLASCLISSESSLDESCA